MERINVPYHYEFWTMESKVVHRRPSVNQTTVRMMRVGEDEGIKTWEKVAILSAREVTSLIELREKRIRDCWWHNQQLLETVESWPKAIQREVRAKILAHRNRPHWEDDEIQPYPDR